MTLPYDHQLLTAEEERGLVLAAQAGDVEARESLVLHNLRLVRACAARYWTQDPAIDMDDFIQIGVVELLRVIPNYDPDLSRFGTYARRFILAAMYRRAVTAGTIYLPPNKSLISEKSRVRAEIARDMRYLEDFYGDGSGSDTYVDFMVDPNADVEGLALLRVELATMRDSLKSKRARVVFDALAEGYSQEDAAAQAGYGRTAARAMMDVLRDRFEAHR